MHTTLIFTLTLTLELMKQVVYFSPMPKLILHRGSAVNDAGRSYKVIVKGQRVGKINDGDMQIYTIPAGDVEIYCKIDWCRSNKITKNLQEHEQLDLLVSGRYTGLMALWNMVCVIITPHKYLLLEEVASTRKASPINAPAQPAT